MADIEANLKLNTDDAKAAADRFARDVGSRPITAPLTAPAAGTTSATTSQPGVSPELAAFASARAMKRGGVSGAELLSIAASASPGVRAAMMSQIGGTGGCGGDLKEAAGELASAVKSAASEIRRVARNPIDSMSEDWRWGGGGMDGGGPPITGGASPGGGGRRGGATWGDVRGFSSVFGGGTSKFFTSVNAFGGRMGSAGGLAGSTIAMFVGASSVGRQQIGPWAQFSEADDVLEQMSARQQVIQAEKYSPERLFGVTDIVAGLGFGQSTEGMVANIQSEERSERRRRTIRASEITLQAAARRRMGYKTGGEYGAGMAGIRADFESRGDSLLEQLREIPTSRTDLRDQNLRERQSNSGDFAAASSRYERHDELSRQSQRNNYLNAYTGASNATTATRANAYDRPMATMQAELDTTRTVNARNRAQLRSTLSSMYGGMMGNMAGGILNASASADSASENYLQARNDAALAERSSDERYRRNMYSAQAGEAEQIMRGQSRPRAALGRTRDENEAEERRARREGLPWAGAMAVAHRATEMLRESDIKSDERLSAGSIDFSNESLRIITDPTKGSFESRQRQAASNTIIRDTQMRAAKAYQEGRSDQVPRIFEQGRLQIGLQQQQYLSGFQSQEVNLNRIAPQDNAANALNAMAKAADNLKNVPTKDDLVKIIDDAVKKIDQTR